LAAYYFDSSALAKFYHQETGTPLVDEIIQASDNKIRISRLTVVELPSVFAIKVRTEFINRDDALVVLRQFREDIISQKIEVFAIRETEFAAAERLIERYAFDLRLRTLDALQIAIALSLKSQALVDHFVAADKVLCAVAALEGFSVVNPEP
jgi:predicted nucleic acid-binding protein